MLNWLRRNETVATLLAVLVLLFANSVVMYRGIDRLIDAQQPTVSALNLVRELERLKTALLDAEAGQRRYLLTGDTKYLELYLAATRLTERELRELDGLAADDRTLADEVTEIRTLVHEKVRELDETVELRRTQGLTAALEMVETDRGKRIMDAMRARIEAIEIKQEARVAASTEQARNSANTTLATFTLGTLLTLGLFALALLVISRDIGGRTRTEAALRQANRRQELGLKTLADHNLRVSLLTEMTGVLQSCVNTGEAFAAVSRYCERLFPGMNGALFMLHSSRDNVELVASWGPQRPLPQLFEPGDCWAIRRAQPHVVAHPATDLVCKHCEGETSPYLCVPLQAQADTLGLLHLLLGEGPLEESWLDELKRLAEGTSRQIALALANIRLRETLRMQSVRDPLTGLFNRRYLEESLDREIARARRVKGRFCLVMIDLDHFKEVNDLYGHEAGDMVLRELGALLRRQVRASDTACRFGGEEFTLLLSDAAAPDALVRCNRLREQIRELVLAHRQQSLGTITASIGLAEYPSHGDSAESLMRAADLALYRAKHQGRDQALIAAPDDHQATAKTSAV